MARARVVERLRASAPGRAGLVAFAVLVAASLWVVLTFPADFGSAHWSNPVVWADHPRSVPPAWVNLLPGPRRPVHRVLELDAPSAVTPAGPVEWRTFEFHFVHDTDEPPTLLAFTLGAIRYADRPPQFTLELHRPDGSHVSLGREVVAGPRPGETAPYVRHVDTPRRLLLSAEARVGDALARTFAATYPVPIDAATLRARPLAALFGQPATDGTLRPLHGAYRFEARFAVADAGDTVDWARLVVGGAVFGLSGTDALGRDLSQGLAFGLPIALLIGVLASTASTVVGTTLGLVSGFVGGRTDLVIQRFADVIANLPVLPLLIFLVFLLGSRLWLILLVLVAFSWPGLAILVRSMVLPLRASPEVEAARVLGASTLHVLWRHVFPHTAPFVLAQLIFFAPGAILAEAGLSFLGLGDPSLPTWGQILEHGFRTGAVFLGYWWWVVPPGLCLVATALSFMLLALGLETVVNPRLERAR